MRRGTVHGILIPEKGDTARAVGKGLIVTRAKTAAELPVIADQEALRTAVNERLDQLVPDLGGPSEAARHSLLAPGKRLRAMLTMIAAAECGGKPDDALDAACAVEMIHTASLVFDDLPAMDDAALRRGVTTPHVLYGVDVAILAGIGLLNGAFGAVAGCTTISDAQKTDLTCILADTVGWRGLVAGQALDLASVEGGGSVNDIHDGKTGVLFEAAVLSGAVVAGCEKEQGPQLRQYAHELGRAYQAFDDILDQVANDEIAGKSTSRDTGKVTAVSASDDQLAAALEKAARHLGDAKSALPAPADADSPLRSFADHIMGHFETTFRRSGMALAG